MGNDVRSRRRFQKASNDLDLRGWLLPLSYWFANADKLTSNLRFFPISRTMDPLRPLLLHRVTPLSPAYPLGIPTFLRIYLIS